MVAPGVVVVAPGGGGGAAQTLVMEKAINQSEASLGNGKHGFRAPKIHTPWEHGRTTDRLSAFLFPPGFCTPSLTR